MIKMLFPTLLLRLVCAISYGQNAQAEFRFVEGKDMFFTPWKGNDENLRRLCEFISLHRESITIGKAPIYVDGYCRNLSRGKVMANCVKSELITQTGMREEYFVTKNMVDSYEGVHNVVVVRISVPQATRAEAQPDNPARSEEAAVMVEEQLRQKPEQTATATVQAETLETLPALPSRFSLRTNQLYLAAVCAGVRHLH